MGKRKAYRKRFTRPPKYCRPWIVKTPGGRTASDPLLPQILECEMDNSDNEEVISHAFFEGMTGSLCSGVFRGFDSTPLNPSVPLPILHQEVHLPSIRVLSLFDGIGTGYLILRKELGLRVEKYYSSEIDENAIRVQQHNFSDNIISIGSVKDITSEMLDEMGRIDLLIGGSPCDELSLVNSRRKGLNDHSGSGVLFFEYIRILKYLKEKPRKAGHHLHWLFENTSRMERETLKEMSRMLGCDPVQHCSSAFVPMVRKRNFWGNIPDLYRIRRACEKDPTHLQDYLRSYKTALVLSVPTLTGNIAAQRSGPHKLPPVLYNGRNEFLGPHEYEILFGFPEHFTDCGLSTCTRVKLIGKSWSVHVVKSLLKPLSFMFRKDI